MAAPLARFAAFTGHSNNLIERERDNYQHGDGCDQVSALLFARGKRWRLNDIGLIR